MENLKTLGGGLTKSFPVLRIVFHQLPFFVALLGGGGLMILEGLHLGPLPQLKAPLREVNLYGERLAAWPETFYKDFLKRVDLFLQDEGQLCALREKAALQQAWEMRARLLQRENTHLKALLNYIPREEKAYAVREIYGRSKGLGEDSFRLTAGGGHPPQRAPSQGKETEGSLKDLNTVGESDLDPALLTGNSSPIAPLSPVVLGQNLVGYVKECGLQTAIVCPLTSSQSRVPVVSERSGLKAIVGGENQGRLTLLHLETTGEFEEGELLLSTSEGALYPEGYVVGKVAFDSRHTPRVIPVVSASDLSRVFILPPVSQRSESP